MHPRVLATLLATLPVTGLADDPPALLTPITVSAPAQDSVPESTGTTAASAADLFADTGVTFSGAGGISALPVMNGLADDRIRIRIDGREVTSACGNHMNPPLSYLDPQQVDSIDVIAGITPVSQGGDSIAGTIAVDTAQPVYARPGEPLRREGGLSYATRSIDHGYVASIEGAVADENLSLGYNASWRAADSYRDGNGDKVPDTLYKARNQSVTFGARGDDRQLVLRIGEQVVPYQGFPNQYMDMVDNQALFANLEYSMALGRGTLDTRVYWQDTEHEMGFFTDEKTGTMPMLTEGSDTGYAISGTLPLSDAQLVRLGHEYHRQRLDDWWPAVSGSMMMGPNDYVNINDGERDRYALYGELESNWGERWTSVLGVREELVRMDTGTVRPYNPVVSMMNQDPLYADAFNALDRSSDDWNLDLTALARYRPGPTAAYEFGVARKTRSPNLYERYAWGRNNMSMAMTGWFGDGNGYVGDPGLEPEVAGTVSAAATWKSVEAGAWEVRLAPRYSYVQDYIDVDPLGTFHPFNIATVDRALLRFANHDARLWGVDASGRITAWDNSRFGHGSVTASLAWTRGERTDGGDLYHIMPLNGTIAVEQLLRAWTNTVELQVVESKTRVDTQRYEPVTAGYALVNLRTDYEMNSRVTLTLGVSNLFDRQYDLPLGGVNLAELKTSGTGPLVSLAGPGRSFDAGISIRF